MDIDEREYCEVYEGFPDQDIEIWLKRWSLVKTVEGWTDDRAMLNAACFLGSGPLTHFMTSGHQFSTWKGFCVSLLQKYGKPEQDTMLQLQLCKQDYAEALQTFFEMTQYPQCAHLDKFLCGLKPRSGSRLRQKVTNICPFDLERAISNAMYLESVYEKPSSECWKQTSQSLVQQCCVVQLSRHSEDMRWTETREIIVKQRHQQYSPEKTDDRMDGYQRERRERATQEYPQKREGYDHHSLIMTLL